MEEPLKPVNKGPLVLAESSLTWLLRALDSASPTMSSFNPRLDAAVRYEAGLENPCIHRDYTHHDVQGQADRPASMLVTSTSICLIPGYVGKYEAVHTDLTPSFAGRCDPHNFWHVTQRLRGRLC